MSFTDDDKHNSSNGVELSGSQHSSETQAVDIPLPQRGPSVEQQSSPSLSTTPTQEQHSGEHSTSKQAQEGGQDDDLERKYAAALRLIEQKNVELAQQAALIDQMRLEKLRTTQEIARLNLTIAQLQHELRVARTSEATEAPSSLSTPSSDECLTLTEGGSSTDLTTMDDRFVNAFEQLSDLQDQIDDLSARVEEVATESSHEHLRQDLNELTKATQEHFAETSSQFVGFDVRAKQASNALSHLTTTSMPALKKEVASLTQSLGTISQSGEDNVFAIRRLKERTKSVEGDVATLRTVSAANAARLAESLETLRCQLDAQESRSSKELATLRSRMADGESRYASMVSQNDLSRFKTEMGDMRKAAEEQSQLASRSQGAQSTSSREQGETANTAAETAADKAWYGNEIRQLTKDNATLTGQLENVTADNASVKADNAWLQDTVSRLIGSSQTSASANGSGRTSSEPHSRSPAHDDTDHDANHGNHEGRARRGGSEARAPDSPRGRSEATLERAWKSM